eukprot:TRINITY_DN12392_c0_g2_i1.p1 TRINITY_DN12392_c0_g2~~TRINITY_DN12392_c0_g2_i1.p1  ORF type:complete len:628 (-),score=120.07 TRINITY_DN12392_c0_g2_i1:181-2064(-)
MQFWYTPQCYGRSVKCFMPFEGGVNYCLFQGCGWCLYSAGLAGTMCVTSLDPIAISSPASGVIFCIGALLFSAQVVLSISVSLFDATSTRLAPAATSAWAQSSVPLSVSLLSLALLVTLDLTCLNNKQMNLPIMSAAVIGIFISLPLSYWRKAPGMRWCHNTMLQLLACFIWSFSCLVGILMCSAIKPSTHHLPSSSNLAFPLGSVGFLTGSGGLLSQILLVLALQSPHRSRFSFPSCPLQPLCTLTRSLIGAIAFCYGWYAVLPLLRRWLDGPMHWYGRWAKDNGMLSQDSLPFFRGVKLQRTVRYGLGASEYMDVIKPHPAPSPKNSATPIVYLHGGGWVCVNTELLSHSVAPLARAGHRVYAVEFPKAPESPFPAPIVSVLRACSWLCRNKKHQRIALLGDSAGGNLATLTAGLLSSPLLLKQFSEAVDPSICSWKFPIIERVASIYGVLDQESWKDTWTGVVLSFCLRCYLPSESECSFRRVTLGDLTVEELEQYPSTLLVCGTGDGLVQSSRAAASQLVAAGRDCTLVEYPGQPHAYHGFPIQWTLGFWKRGSLPTTVDLVEFFSQKKLKKEYPAKDVPFDWSLPFMLAGTVITPLVLIGLVFWVAMVQICSWVQQMAIAVM